MDFLGFDTDVLELGTWTGGRDWGRPWRPELGARPRMPPALGHHCILCQVTLHRALRGDLLAMETQERILPGDSSCSSVTLQDWGTENLSRGSQRTGECSVYYIPVPMLRSRAQE